MSSALRSLRIVAILVLLIAPHSFAFTSTWTGLAAPDSSWATPGNWNNGVPISADTAVFSGTGNGNVSVSLGGVRPIHTVQFAGGAAAYSVGVLASGDVFEFDSGGEINVSGSVPTLETVNADIRSTGSLAVTNSGATRLSLAGSIAINDGGTLTVTNATASTTTTLSGAISEESNQPASLALIATTLGTNNANNFVISGINSYTGPTTIQVNTGSNGRIQIGSSSPFGTGVVNLNEVTGATISPVFSALSDGLTIPNAMKLNSSVALSGTNSLSFNGPITVTNAAGDSRTFGSSITGGGKRATLGAFPGASTITLGNPTASGGDNIGKTLNIIAGAFSTIVVNHVMQDPVPGGGTASGSVRYAGSNSGVTAINALNTYSGTTYIENSTTVQIINDYHSGDAAGPFGIGSLSISGGRLQPLGGNRTLAYAISGSAISMSNAAGDTSSLTLTAPIVLTGSGISNLASEGTLTLGSADHPSTITLPSNFSPSINTQGGGPIVINDVIQDTLPLPTPKPQLHFGGSGKIRINSLSTHSRSMQVPGGSTTFQIGASSNGLPGSFTAGPFGVGNLSLNQAQQSLQPIGGDRTISNAIGTIHGFIVSNPSLEEDPTGPHDLTLAGPISLTTLDTVIRNNMSPGAALIVGDMAQPSTLTIRDGIRITSATDGTTVINSTIVDAASGPGSLIIENSSVQMNGLSSYSGTTFVDNDSKLFVNGTKPGTGTVTNYGTLGGTGSIAGALVNGGRISPGIGVGTLTAGGNVSMLAGSRLAIELSDGAADKLAVGGNLDLSNADFLDISRVGGGGSWVIATYAGTLTGTFDNVTPGYTVNYGSGSNSQITLFAAPTGVAGDFNNDGIVNAADYALWRQNSGSGVALLNDNGLGAPVRTAHYDLWRSNFGAGSGSGSESDWHTAVPEPSILALLSVAFAWQMSRQRVIRR